MSPPGARSLKGPGAVLLVSCYELGHQPLSLASPAAWLRRAGYLPAAIDLAVERLDPEHVAAARLVAIAVPMHTALRLGVRAMARVRSLNPGVFVCLYGLYATLNADHLLAHGADAVIGGEFEEPLLRLVESRHTAESAPLSGDPAPVPGVRTRHAASGPWLARIPFAVPARDLLAPLDRYARLDTGGETRLAGQVEASRGCLHHCRHCPIPPVYGGRFFVVPRAVVMADIRAQVAAGAAHITFGDPDFLNGPGHALALARALHEEFPRLTFDCTAKIEHLLEHAGILPELRRCGCLFVVSAVESLSDRVLEILDKGHTRADVARALERMRGAGIILRPSFVPFTPWTTRDDYLELLEFVAGEDLIDAVDPVQLAIRLLVPPGSLLADHPAMRPHLGALDAARFAWTWRHPDPAMDRLHEDVTRLVERAALRVADPRETFRAVLTLAVRAGRRSGTGDNPPALPIPPARADKGRPPRLTEPWFC